MNTLASTRCFLPTRHEGPSVRHPKASNSARSRTSRWRTRLGLAGLAIFASCGASKENVQGFYGDGLSLRFEGEVSVDDDGVQRSEGLWTFWYPDGTVQTRGRYLSGGVPGPAESLEDQTRVPEKGRTGKWRGFRPDLEPDWEGEFKDGRRHGVFSFWHSNGQLRLRAQFENGKESGPFRVYYEDGSLAFTGRYDNGLLDEQYEIYHRLGQLLEQGDWDLGKRVGLHRVWDETGMLREEAVYREGMLNGMRNVWDEEGNPIMLSLYKEGKPHGATTLLHPNGKRKAFGLYQSGKREGVHVVWDYEGNKVVEMEYRDGVPTGQLTTFYEGGQKSAEGALEGGVPVGRHRIWSDTGEILGEGQYGTQQDPMSAKGSWKFWKSLPSRPVQTLPIEDEFGEEDSSSNEPLGRTNSEGDSK